MRIADMHGMQVAEYLRRDDRCVLQLGDGNCGGAYQHSDDAMLRIWRAAVEETRALVEGPWSA